MQKPSSFSTFHFASYILIEWIIQYRLLYYNLVIVLMDKLT